MFNALYVLPVGGILLLRLLTGERSAALLARASRLIERLAPFVLVGTGNPTRAGPCIRFRSVRDGMVPTAMRDDRLWLSSR
jgi:hypothetical protein